VYAIVVSVTVGIRKFRENLSHYLDLVGEGREVVVITDRGKPVARLEGPSNLERLIAEGRVIPAKRPKGPLPPLEKLPKIGPPYLSDVVIEGHGH
jgi:prevent-host-death family protein